MQVEVDGESTSQCARELKITIVKYVKCIIIRVPPRVLLDTCSMYVWKYGKGLFFIYP